VSAKDKLRQAQVDETRAQVLIAEMKNLASKEHRSP
jgi:hypothetical protein